MPLPATFLKPVSDAIGDALTLEQLQDIVATATGNGLFEEFATPNDPRRVAVRRTLERLIDEGTERWLLTYVLLGAVTNDPLRRLIVKACPETLVSLPNVDQQVDRALKALDLVAAALTLEFKRQIRPSRDRLSAISGQIATLLAYKHLHECLHVLNLKLSVKPTLQAGADDRARLDDLTDTRQEVERACATGRQAAAPLGAETAIELAWIAELERLSAELAGSDASAAATSLTQVQRLIRLQLPRLNRNILDTANQLSLHELMLVLPMEVRLEEAFIEMSHAIRDLKVTVIARALLHKIWQDADNELSLIEDFLGTATGEARQFAEHWLTLRSQILWLASLDPDAEWSKQAKRHSEHIDDEMTEEKLDEEIKPSLANYGRVVRFRFFAIDAMLKADYGALGKFHTPLKRMVEEIGNG